MKKILIILITIISILLLTLLFINLNNKNEKQLDFSEQIENKMKDEEIGNKIDKVITQASSTEEKITPTTKMILKKYYKACGHAINSYVELPKEFINLNKEEVQSRYKDWNIEKFSSKEVILLKDEDGFCNEHYLLKEKDGFVAIYLIDRAGQEVLKEITDISIQYLTQKDSLNLKNGIKIYGIEQLNKTLEDYE